MQSEEDSESIYYDEEDFMSQQQQQQQQQQTATDDNDYYQDDNYSQRNTNYNSEERRYNEYDNDDEEQEYRDRSEYYGANVVMRIRSISSNALLIVKTLDLSLRKKYQVAEKKGNKRKTEYSEQNNKIPDGYRFKKYKIELREVETIERLIENRFYDVKNEKRGYNESARNKWGNSRTRRAIAIFGNTNKNLQQLKDDHRNLLAAPPVFNTTKDNIFYMRSQTNADNRIPYKIVISKDGNRHSCTCPDFVINKARNDLYISNRRKGFIRDRYVKKVITPLSYVVICKHIRCAYAMITINSSRKRGNPLDSSSNNSVDNNKRLTEMQNRFKGSSSISDSLSMRTLIKSSHSSSINQQLSEIFGCYVDSNANLLSITDRNAWKQLPFELLDDLSKEIYDGYFLGNKYINEICSRMNIDSNRVLLLLNNCFGYNRIQRAYIIVEKLSFYIRPLSQILNHNLIKSTSVNNINKYLSSPSTHLVYFIPEVETRSYDYWLSNNEGSSFIIRGQAIVYSSDLYTCTCYEYNNLNVEFCQHLIAFYYFYLKSSSSVSTSNPISKSFQGVPINVWRYIHLMDSKQKSNNSYSVPNPIINEINYSSLSFTENSSLISSINVEEIKKLTVTNSLSYYNENWKRNNYSITVKFSKKTSSLSYIKAFTYNQNIKIY